MKTWSSNEISEATQSLRDNLGRLEGTKVLVLGDLGLDEYLLGDVRRISPEAPVPVFEVMKEEYRVGLAANVAQNLVSLGGRASLLGVVGQDETAKKLSKLLAENGVGEFDFIEDSERPTTKKTRVMSGQHHIVRVDYEKRKYIKSNLSDQLITKLQSAISGVQGLILQDYGKGTFSEDFCQKVIKIAKEKGKVVIVDPHRTTPVHFFRGADVVKPNFEEAFVLSGLNYDDRREGLEGLSEVAQALIEKTKAKILLVTKGKDGVYIFTDNKVTQIPTSPRQVFDVTGAGDTFVAAFSLSWLGGFSLEQSSIMANAAAGVVVGKVGSVPCTKDQLFDAL